jgi:hypothetical protein
MGGGSLDLRRKMRAVVSTAKSATDVDKKTGRVEIDEMGLVYDEACRLSMGGVRLGAWRGKEGI